MLKFRNIDATPDDPVSTWGVEGIAAALERGYLPHWQRIARAVREAPHGRVADELEAAIAALEPNGATSLLTGILADARAGDEALVADAVRADVRRSGLTVRAFAAELGTSPSRLSTYMTGKVTPSAAVARRIARLAEHHARGGDLHPGRALRDSVA